MAIKYSLSWPIETQTHTHTDTCDKADQSDVRLGCVCVCAQPSEFAVSLTSLTTKGL